MFNEVILNNRLDAEFFKREYLDSTTLLKSLEYSAISNFAKVTDGIHASIDFDEDSKINLLSAMSPKENYFELSSNGYISAKQHSENSRTSLRKNDIILSTVGTIGNCAVVDENILPANCDRHVGIIRIRGEYKPHYVSTFLLSKYGRFQTQRYITGNVQPNLFIENINRLIVPFISKEFQNYIENYVASALQLKQKSTDMYLNASTSLLRSLGMDKFVSRQETVAIKSLSESYKMSNRLDAEYYQKKYEEYENSIKTYPSGYAYIYEKFTQVVDKCNKSKEKYPYIEIGNVSIDDGGYNYNVINSQDLPANAKIMVNRKDLLVSKVRPNRGAVAIIDNYVTDLVVSGAFTVLRSKSDYRLEVLSALLRTKIYRDWFLKFNVGSSYPTIKDEDVLNMPIPLIDADIQTMIAEQVQQSFALRWQSEYLLEQAKCAVEIAIEKGEEKATAWLKDKGVEKKC